MFKFKKTVISVLMVLAILASFVGCGDKEDTSSFNNDDDFFADSEDVIDVESQENTNTETKDNTKPKKPASGKNTCGGKSWDGVLASMPAKLKGTTVSVFNWNPKSEYGGAAAVIQDFENETGIKVNWINADYNTYQTKLAALVASGDSPDVARTNRPFSTAMRSFQPLDAAQYDFSDGAWDQSVMKDYSVNGKVYATTLNKTHIGSMSFMFYNKSLIDKYDLENPYQLWKKGKWTWSKFLSMCREFKKESGSEFAAGSWEWSGLTQIFGIGGPYTYDGTKYYSLLDDSKFLSVTQEIADLYNTENLIHEWGSPEFDKGELLFWSGGSIYGRRMNTYFSTLKKNGTLYAVPLPAADNQSTYYQGRHEYEAYALVKGAKNPTAVPYFLRYFLNPDNYDLTSFYSNAQMIEVYDWCASQPNKIWTTNYWDQLNRTVFDNIRQMKGNQIQNFIDSNASIIDQRVKEMNDALKKLE